MSVIQGINFESHPLATTTFSDVPGVYVITTSQKWLDVGQTDKLGQRLTSHERKADWLREAGGLTIWVNFLRIDNEQRRLNLETNLRTNLRPVCGEK